MGTLYFTRHGETSWNIEHKICGITDIELNEKGKEDARKLAERIMEEKIAIDEILYSPLSRAKQTAFIISQAAKIPANEEKLLLERNCGRFEGTLNTAAEFIAAQKQICNDYGGGESMLRVTQRIYNLLDRLTKENGKTYLLVGHNGIARSVESYFNAELTTEGFVDFRMKNCELRRYDF